MTDARSSTTGEAPPAAGLGGRVVVDGRPIPFEGGDSVAVAILRAAEVPGSGGTLCLAGDCGNCVAVVDGVAWTRTCLVPARAGLAIERHPANGLPSLPVRESVGATEAPGERRFHVERRVVDVAIIGGELDARRGGRSVAVLDSASGHEVVSIHDGPTIIARTARGMVHVRAGEVEVATGAAEVHPACPGNDLAGLLTAGAAEQLHAAGVDLGDAVALGTPPDGVPCRRVDGRLIRFEGESGRVVAVVTADEHGAETRTSCTTAILGLGLAARDLLARMAGEEGHVQTVGAAAESYPLPAAPVAGVVCRCSGTTVDDLETAWARGFTELELLKRASLAGLGTCQGGACLPQLRAWIAARTGSIPDPFTARPAARQPTLAEVAADTWVDAFRRTPLHDEHVAAGGRMDRFGTWWRPWHYGDPPAEYWAVREGVSVGDVSTLGKLVVSGPDVVEALERIYPCRVVDLKPGRSRYALLLNERGHVMDDGMILRDADTRFTLTFTSSGASNAEMWIRDWIETWGLRVHTMDRTASLAAINVTGPLARDLLMRAGLPDPPRFLSHVRADVAGVPCHVMRLSFTGEASWELHHSVDRSVELWRALMELGADLGIRPHGLRALQALRLEKGHVIIGMDTELDSTPRRLGMDWAVRMDKPSFLGRSALERTGALPDERRLFGITMEGRAPIEGTPIRVGGEIVGHVTSSFDSPSLRRAVMLGWQKRTPFAERVEIDGREATVTDAPFYDPEGHRARS